ncbi:PAS domain S-box protein [Desulfosporosinus sp. PR]|uniref:PAS domain S-box protein n=1 Tax=Candidatus Desulfosporosinus nitrosoreducens TaxID=3401928 RepID=UPI0027FF4629|nr:PAS domain S-box protein [Desulfosporosinus sp. PR]MDQ7097029.1 PAS domain S-box protein [Desulfosporosinus sp. PR]
MTYKELDHDISEHHCEDSFTLLLDQIDEYLLILKDTGEIIHVNKAAAEKLDYALDELTTMNIKQLFPLSGRREVLEFLKGSQEGRSAQEFLELCSKSQKHVCMEVRLSRGTWEGQEVLYGLGKDVKLEIDDQKFKDYQSMLDSMPFLAWIKDKNGKYVIINKNFESFYNIKNTIIVGKTDFDFFPYRIALKHKKSEEELIKSGKNMLNLQPHHHEIGGKWLETFVAPFFEYDGMLAGTLGVAREITNRKLLEKQLREQAEYAELLFRTVPSAVLSVDKDRKIIRWNKIAEELTGYSEAEAIGKECSMVLHGVGIEGCYLCRNASESPLINETCKIVTKNGQIRHVLKSIAVLKNEFGEVSEKMECLEDITEMINIEEKLYERERQTQLELSLAARVQQESLPPPFSGDKVRVSTIFESFSKVSGDFFNYKWFERQNKLCGYIIDVCGHGLATAMQTATFKMMLDNVLLTGERITENDLKIINRRIMPYLYEGSFVALLYYEFDLQAKVLKLISAGITLFLAINSEECSLVPLSGCYLGIIDDPDIEMVTVPIRPGEMYCMMSDGVSDLIELHGVSKQQGFKGYLDWLEKLADCPERNDDFSAVCIEILQENDNKDTNVLDIKNDRDLERAQTIISEFLERNAAIHAPELEVAINEAMNNGFFACGQVHVKTRRVGRKLIVRVKDDCSGFNTKNVKSLTINNDLFDREFDELLGEEGGRGIFLMRAFCDKVIYNATGNEVLLMKKIRFR